MGRSIKDVLLECQKMRVGQNSGLLHFLMPCNPVESSTLCAMNVDAMKVDPDKQRREICLSAGLSYVYLLNRGQGPKEAGSVVRCSGNSGKVLLCHFGESNW